MRRHQLFVDVLSTIFGVGIIIHQLKIFHENHSAEVIHLSLKRDVSLVTLVSNSSYKLIKVLENTLE